MAQATKIYTHSRFLQGQIIDCSEQFGDQVFATKWSVVKSLTEDEGGVIFHKSVELVPDPSRPVPADAGSRFGLVRQLTFQRPTR
jgi:hypothetical protein